MRIVRGRADARWLPSRHRFAIFRLFAYLRLRRAKPERNDALMLAVDRDQSAYEHHAASLWIVLTVTCYVAGTMFGRWPVPLAVAAALPVSAVLIEIPVYVSGLLLRAGSRVNGIVFMTLLGGASLYLARQATWVRYAAWQFLAVVTLNALAAAFVFVLRHAIARLERGVLSDE